MRVSYDFFFSSRRRHTRWNCDWSSDVCSSDLIGPAGSSAHTAAMPADCPMMADDSSMSGPACGAHCLPHEQADRGADVRIAALGPPAVLVFRAVRPVVAAAMRAMPPLARIASPPQSLRFGRFLI